MLRLDFWTVEEGDLSALQIVHAVSPPGFLVRGLRAKMLGFEGLVMKSPEEILPGWKHALEADRPVVIEAHTDPEVPPLPPHIRFEQAKKYISWMTKGEEGTWHVMKQSAKHIAQDFKPKKADE